MSTLEISTDRERLDVGMITAFLSNSYWAQGREKTLVETSIRHSLCFGAYLDNEQVGFARVITDYAVFGYVADVFVLEPYRKRGYARELLQAIVDHPELQALRLVMLATRDAHGLYEQFGFELLPGSDRVMTLFAIRD